MNYTKIILSCMAISCMLCILYTDSVSVSTSSWHSSTWVERGSLQKVFSNFFFIVSDNLCLSGVSTPLRQSCISFPLCFRFPPYFKKFFRLRRKFSQFQLFPKKISDFHWPNFWWLFFRWLQILNSPLFSMFQYISPLFRQNYYYPYFFKFPWFRNIYVFFTYFMCFSFPPSLTMMHLCITQCTYWMLLVPLMILYLKY